MVPALLCPGFATARPELSEGAPSADAIVYVNNTASTLVPGYTGTVWGHPDVAEPRNSPVSIDKIQNPSRTWMLGDMDNRLAVAWAYSGWEPERMSAEPVHSSTRNRLYFDGHVESVPLNAPPI